MAETMTSHLQFRQRVYTEEMWVIDGSQNPFQLNHPHYTRCLLPWLQREIEALLLHQRDQMRLMGAMLWELSRDPPSLGELTDMVRRYLGPRTSHFLHEFFAFSGSQLTMEEYDLTAQYPLVIPSPQVTSDDECQVIGSVRPRSERTPEIVDLFSDDASAAAIDTSSDYRICDPVLPSSPERHSLPYCSPSPSYCQSPPSTPSPPYRPISPGYCSPSPSYCQSSPPSWFGHPLTVILTIIFAYLSLPLLQIPQVTVHLPLAIRSSHRFCRLWVSLCTVCFLVLFHYVKPVKYFYFYLKPI